MKLDPTIFRASDIRGIIGQNLGPDIVREIGRAFGTVMRLRGFKHAALGYDGRLSSPDLEQAMAEGLTQSGINVTRVGRGSSPMLYFATHHLNTDAGIMITGSHNPPDYNGIKMMLGGQSFCGQDIQDLIPRIEARDYETGQGGIEEADIAEDYLDRLLIDYKHPTPLTIAWDAGNGAAGALTEALSRRLPGRQILLNTEIDGTFPAHHPDPTVEQNLDQLKQAVLSQGCDLGFAFDGDGDRIGVVDAKGRTVWADQLMILFAREILATAPGATVIGDVKCSQTLFDEIARLGGNPVMWKSGHAMIKTKMVESGALLAGEMSAHIFFKHDYYGFDDALYAAVRLLSILASQDVRLDQLLDSLPATISTPEIRFDCDEDKKFQVVSDVAQRLKQKDGLNICDLDGVRVTTPDGWWLLRASNTQAVLVARCEASNQAGLDRLRADLTAQLDQSGVSLPD